MIDTVGKQVAELSVRVVRFFIPQKNPKSLILTMVQS